MPIRTRIESAAGVVICTVEGDFDLAEAAAAVDAYLTHPEFRAGMNILWDLANANLAAVFPAEKPWLFVNAFEKRREQRGAGYKLAIVAKGDLEFGISRQYEAVTDGLPFASNVFRDYDDAWRWLQE